MHSRMSWDDLWPLLWDGTLETVYMVGLAAVFTVLLGLPVGVVLFISQKRVAADAETQRAAGGSD